ncbi:hypothetical protein [Effusibacillus consociatus]|uniref:Spore coat protein n=1 Tax=Effusibacillus consociatus TaxID=1117041 RepID=A0ABV9PV68_9BACL
MSKEENVLTPGNEVSEREGMLKGTDTSDWEGTTVPGQSPTPGFVWDQVPYAPPFHIAQGTAYPQMYQVPTNYFQEFPHLTNSIVGERTTDGENHQLPWGNPYGYPLSHYGYSPYSYYQSYQHNHDQATEASQLATTDTARDNQGDTRLFPFFPPFGFGFGFPFFPRPFFPGPFFGPFFPRPFFPGPFFPRPWW